MAWFDRNGRRIMENNGRRIMEENDSFGLWDMIVWGIINMRGSDGVIEDKNGAVIELDMGVKVGLMMGDMEENSGRE